MKRRGDQVERRSERGEREWERGRRREVEAEEGKDKRRGNRRKLR